MSKRKRGEEEEEDKTEEDDNSELDVIKTHSMDWVEYWEGMNQSDITFDPSIPIFSIWLKNSEDCYELNYAKTDKIPKETFFLRNLRCIRFSNNAITKVPKVPKEINNWGITLETIIFHKNPGLCELPKELSTLSNLKYIDLGKCDFEKFPKVLFSLEKLKYIELSGNKIKKIPRIIGFLTNLKFLYLRDNFITELPSEIGKLKRLIEFRLSRNQIVRLPKEINQLTSLEILYLDENRLIEIPKGMTCLTNIHTLELQNNQLTNIPIGITNLPCLLDDINVFDNPLEFEDHLPKLYHHFTLYKYMKIRSEMLKLCIILFCYRMKVLNSELSNIVMHNSIL